MKSEEWKRTKMKNEKERRAKREGYPDWLVGQHGGEPRFVPLVGERGVDVRPAAAARATHPHTHTRVGVCRVVSCACRVVSLVYDGERSVPAAVGAVGEANDAVQPVHVHETALPAHLHRPHAFVRAVSICRASCQFVVSFEKHNSCFVSFRFVGGRTFFARSRHGLNCATPAQHITLISYNI